MSASALINTEPKAPEKNNALPRTKDDLPTQKGQRDEAGKRIKTKLSSTQSKTQKLIRTFQKSDVQYWIVKAENAYTSEVSVRARRSVTRQIAVIPQKTKMLMAVPTKAKNGCATAF